ncbi:MAG TPA: TlpA disulfide reductase family protein [Myxococcaceae bacterium]|nr:TlpA disulfide reductase family protein [Myxococcaceae bacterium]
MTTHSKAKKATYPLGTILVGLLFGAFLYLGVREAKQSHTLAQGAPAPGFSLARYEGGTLSLSALRGKVVLLDFWASWCEPCLAEIPFLVKLAREYEPMGLVLVAVNRDEGANVKASVGVFVAKQAPDLAPYIVFADTAVAAHYQINFLPTVYFIDREGKILSSYSGYSPEAAMRSRVEQALSSAR